MSTGYVRAGVERLTARELVLVCLELFLERTNGVGVLVEEDLGEKKQLISGRVVRCLNARTTFNSLFHNQP